MRGAFFDWVDAWWMAVGVGIGVGVTLFVQAWLEWREARRPRVAKPPAMVDVSEVERRRRDRAWQEVEDAWRRARKAWRR